MAAWKTAGKVRMTPKGEHSPNSTYEVLREVPLKDIEGMEQLDGAVATLR